jgi:hypothetical protein
VLAAGQRRAGRLDAGDRGDQRVEDQAQARAAGVDHPGVAEGGQLAGVASRAARAPSAAARTTSASAVRPSSTAATAASGTGARDGEEGALLGVGHRAVGGVGRLLQGGGEGRAVGRRLAGELVGQAAEELGEDRAGVAPGAEHGAAGEDGPGGLGAARPRRGVERGHGRLGGEQEVGAGVAVGHREDVEVVEPAAGLGQGLDRGPAPLADRGVVQRLQHGRRVPMPPTATGDRAGGTRSGGPRGAWRRHPRKNG